MKKVLSFLAIIGLAAGSVFAGCGKKVETVGTLTKYNEEKKTIKIEGADKPIKITATTKGADKLADLTGKKVKVISEHGKADSVAAEG